MGNSIVAFARQVADGIGSVIGVRAGTEEPPYTHTRLTHNVEIRRYEERIAAQTTVFGDDESAARSTGFRRLAGYIFGGNHRNTKIAMTAPVSQQAGQKIAMTAPVSQEADPEGGSVIRFFMPAELTMEELPTPNDSSIVLVTVPAETLAVLRFTGDRSPKAVASRTVHLLDTLQDNGFKPNGEPNAWFYDPPWTLPFRRRNEVAVAVTPL
ncbi:SOUL family heme-binding protein [Mycolicibacterium komossense]|uniref:Heme-binding protein n=1 Tax=Mycolicibacterium komossense TaxID=1779 RepID=A0ABT3C6A4_9MYCO|nr:heme-binding protein [Mycolicibacterium komossense]MCV7224987.1 heme-binding protein [Mycolicibacterium komossense]